MGAGEPKIDFDNEWSERVYLTANIGVFWALYHLHMATYA